MDLPTSRMNEMILFENILGEKCWRVLIDGMIVFREELILSFKDFKNMCFGMYSIKIDFIHTPQQFGGSLASKAKTIL